MNKAPATTNAAIVALPMVRADSRFSSANVEIPSNPRKLNTAIDTAPKSRDGTPGHITQQGRIRISLDCSPTAARTPLPGRQARVEGVAVGVRAPGRDSAARRLRSGRLTA